MAKSIVELREDLARREQQLGQMRARRENIVSQLATVDAAIQSLLGNAAPVRAGSKPAAPDVEPAQVAGKQRPGRPRGRRSGHSLASALASALAGKGPVKVADAMQLVRKAGYKTRSKHFGNIVGHALTTDPRFRKVSRGVYEVR